MDNQFSLFTICVYVILFLFFKKKNNNLFVHKQRQLSNQYQNICDLFVYKK